MKNIIILIVNTIFTIHLSFIIFSCNNNTALNKQEKSKTAILSASLAKPSATFQDTLFINLPSVVFFLPDSLQLLKIKEQTDSIFYEGSMHEYYFQMKNARITIKKNWPWLTIIESKNCRYLAFIKKDGSKEYVDLNTKNDPYGLFVFNGQKPPLLTDMTNLETAISFYLAE